MCVGVCWGNTFVRQHFGKEKEIGFLCGEREKVLLFYGTKFNNKGERKVMERSPTWSKWNPYDSIL